MKIRKGLLRKVVILVIVGVFCSIQVSWADWSDSLYKNFQRMPQGFKRFLKLEKVKIEGIQSKQEL